MELNSEIIIFLLQYNEYYLSSFKWDNIFIYFSHIIICIFVFCVMSSFFPWPLRQSMCLGLSSAKSSDVDEIWCLYVYDLTKWAHFFLFAKSLDV